MSAKPRPNRAFECEGASRANPFDETSLRLFTVHENELRMVLDGLAIGDAQRRGYRHLIAHYRIPKALRSMDRDTTG